MPSFTFVSTANAVALRGAVPVFVDVRPDTLNLDESLIDQAISDRTRAIVPVHYAGISCEMDTILEIARERGIAVLEDAAHAIDCHYEGRALGAIGDLGCLSFDGQKNVTCGEGGALCSSVTRRWSSVPRTSAPRAPTDRNSCRVRWIGTNGSRSDRPSFQVSLRQRPSSLLSSRALRR